jgi:hypothetical protein
MKIGKMIVQGKEYEAIEKKFPNNLSIRGEVCGDKCCYTTVYTLTGKTSVSFDYDVSMATLKRELSIRERLAQVPFGTAISI